MEPSQKTLTVARLSGTDNRQLFFALSATEKCGRNRQIYIKEWVVIVRPFGSLLRAKAMCGDADGCGEGKKKGLPPEYERSPVWSAVLNEVRTFFEGEEGEIS